MPPPPRAASPPLGSHSTPIVGHQTLGAPHKAPSTLLSFAVQSRAAKEEEEEGGLKEAVQSRDAWLLVPNGVGGSGGSFAGIPPGRSPRKGCAPISPTLQESSSLNPRQTNDASSNKPRYHDINNIYFQAKPQPGLLIPVIKANGSSVISFASPQAAPYVLISAFILSHRVPPGGDHPDPHALCHIPGAMCYGPSPEQSSPRARSERQTAAFNLVRSTSARPGTGHRYSGTAGSPRPAAASDPQPRAGQCRPRLSAPYLARPGSARLGAARLPGSTAEQRGGGAGRGHGRGGPATLPAPGQSQRQPPPSLPFSHPFPTSCPHPIPTYHIIPVFHSPFPSLSLTLFPFSISHPPSSPLAVPLSHPIPGGVPAAFHPTGHAQPPAAPPEPPHPHTGARCGTRASPAHHPHHPQPSRIPSGLSSLHGGLSSTGIPQPGSTLLDHQPEPRACLHTSCKAQTTGPSCKSFIRSNSDIFHETKPKEPLELENSGRTEHAPAFTTGHVPPLGVGF